MVFASSRKKNSKFYWLELGFILLGIIGWNPSIITSVLESKGTAIIQQQFPTQYHQANNYQRNNYQGQPIIQNPYDRSHDQPGSHSQLYTNLQNTADPSFYANPQQLFSQQSLANQQNQAQQPYNYGAQNSSGSQWGYPINTGLQNSQPTSNGTWNSGYPASTTAPATTVPPATLNSPYNSQSTFSNWPSTSPSAYSQQNSGYSSGFPTTANLQTNAINPQFPTVSQYGAYGQYGSGNPSQFQNAAYPPSAANFNPASTNFNGFVPAGSTANSLGAQPNRYGYSNGYQPLNPATNATSGRY
jgi:hypothetical protein